MASADEKPAPDPKPGDPARCLRCGHVCTFAPLDPETGALRLECPACGEPALRPQQGSAARAFFLSRPKARPHRIAGSVYSPSRPRPSGFLAGSIFDLKVLFETTIVVFRKGALAAFSSLLALGTCGAIVIGTPIFVVGLVPFPPFVCCMFPLVFLGIALVYAGPLAVFSIVIEGKTPRFEDAFWKGVMGSWSLSVTIAGALVLAFACALGNALVVGPHTDPTGLIPSACFAWAFAWFYLRFFLLSHLVAVASTPGLEWIGFTEIWPLTRGRTVMLAFVAGIPVAIQAAASPTPFARSLVESAVGRDAAVVLAIAAGALGWVFSVLLGSALLASAYLILIESPIEEDQVQG